ncbi:hypothetical protein AB833_24115 [Chromatiales bacterium (ex Bugula neritina AB1)]|nr:hypothetical protein AB833_24115 [Chromatiales bacterium (ex Bugula neritina AB1)]
MDSTVYATHARYYNNTVAAIEKAHSTPGDLCFIFVQHAFLPSLTFFSSIDRQVAAVVPKGSSAKSNPEVVQQLKARYGDRVYSDITRSRLADVEYTVKWLQQVALGRPFAILEYGGYFAPAAAAISNDPVLGRQLVGFVEGTENGIKGSDDGKTPGYRDVAHRLRHPVISKSRSRIKSIMDLEIGSAIVYATDGIFRRNLGCSLKYWRGRVGVIGLGIIGKGVLRTLAKDNCQPYVFDTNLSIMAELAIRQNHIVSQKQVLRQSDLLFLNTGSCFLSKAPELLAEIRDGAVIVLCTSGDVEAGIPQLVASGHLTLSVTDSTDEIAVFTTRYQKKVRVLLARDGVGQAPNMSMEDGSSSPANLMSDMEFYALGKYLASSRCKLKPGDIHVTPDELENLILREWLREFYPACGVSDVAHAGFQDASCSVADLEAVADLEGEFSIRQDQSFEALPAYESPDREFC